MKTVDSRRPNPFPGLRPFRSDEHHLFFGREEQTAALLQLLRTNRFLAVVGASGSGTSAPVRRVGRTTALQQVVHRLEAIYEGLPFPVQALSFDPE